MARVDPSEYDLPNGDEVQKQMRGVFAQITKDLGLDKKSIMVGIYAGCKLTLGDRSKGLAYALWGNGNPDPDFVWTHEKFSRYLAETIEQDIASFLFTRGIHTDINTHVRGADEGDALAEAMKIMEQGDGAS